MKNNKLSNDIILDSYKKAFLIRKFEEQTSKSYGLRKIRGFCHLYIGQEAIAAALVAIKGKDDTVITSYRAHGIALAAGCSPKSLMAELMGKATGCSMGLGGSMHTFYLENNLFGGHGIVGAQIPLGTGLAFAMKYKEKKGAVSYTLLGDGAVNQGQFYESMNMAKLWNLPVVYIIENNHYSMGTSVSRGCANEELYNRGESFGIHGFCASGMDFVETHAAIVKAKKICIKESSPVVLELKTYRYKGHSMSDPALYRDKSELSHYKLQDPVEKLKFHCIENNIATENQIDQIEEKIKEDIREAIEFAENSPECPDEFIDKFIYK